MEFINISDIINKDSGKTYREENESKKHNIPLGTMVEVIEDDSHESLGIRLFVVYHYRDCDGTPLYGLSFKKDWSMDMYGKSLVFITKAMVDLGYPECSLTIVSKK